MFKQDAIVAVLRFYHSPTADHAITMCHKIEIFAIATDIAPWEAQHIVESEAAKRLSR